MGPDEDKVKIIKEWPKPEDKAAVKSFLQTVQFYGVFLNPTDGSTYADITAPLRELTRKDSRYKWTKECDKAFEKIKSLLCSDRIIAAYDPKLKTRLYVDDGPEGVAGTLAQAHPHPHIVGKEVWRPVNYTARAKETPEKGYSKVEGESLALLSRIKANKMFLQGTTFEVVVDHQPLVSLYNKNKSSDAMPERVARHKSKLTSYDFTVVYESGKSTPSDYGSRHPPKRREMTKSEKEEMGVE